MPAEMVDGGSDAVAAPRSFTVPATAPYSLTSVKATFNGAAAGGEFLAALSVYTQDGKLVSRYGVEESVTAGDTALKTFSPFSSGGIAAGGIRYRRQNVGGWLYVKTTGLRPATANGMEFVAADGGIAITATDQVDGQVVITTPYFEVVTANGRLRLLDSGEVFWEGTDVSINWNNGYAIAADQHTFDISALGGTFEVNDSAGNPLLTLTG